jgi:hypothetical protein
MLIVALRSPIEIMDYQKQRFDHRNALFGFVAFISENILKFVSFRFDSVSLFGFSLSQVCCRLGSLSLGFSFSRRFIVDWVHSLGSFSLGFFVGSASTFGFGFSSFGHSRLGSLSLGFIVALGSVGLGSVRLG